MGALLCLTFALSKCTGCVLDALIPSLSSFLPNESPSVSYLHIIQVYGICTGCCYPWFVFFLTQWEPFCALPSHYPSVRGVYWMLLSLVCLLSYPMRALLCLTFILSKCPGCVLEVLTPSLSSFLPNESPSVPYLHIIQVYWMCTGCSNPQFALSYPMRALLCLTFTLSKCTGCVLDALIPSLSSFLPNESPSVSRSTRKHVIPL